MINAEIDRMLQQEENELNSPEDRRSELTDLLPCPFCGGTPIVWWDNPTIKEGCNIECSCEKAQVYAIFGDEAAESWNTRAM